MKTIRLCCVIPSLNAGGMERVMSELLFFFAAPPGIDLHLVMYGRYPSSFYNLPASLTIHKPDFQYDDRLRFWYTIKTLFFLRSRIKQINPDTILSFGEYWNSLVLLSLWGTSYPVYISDRCQPDKQFSRMHRFLRKALYPLAKGIVAQTQKAKEIYFRNFRHYSITVIGNPIKISSGSGSNTHDNKVILTVGRLISTKHHDRLIRIFSELDAPGWKLVIVGGNALKQNNLVRLEDLVNQLGLNERIILTGEIKNVDHYYRTSQIFAFTSSSEGFPNVVLEALASGLPVVAYDCIAGPSEMIVDGKNGFLIPLHDEKTFKNMLLTLISNPLLIKEMSANTKESIKHFDIEIIGNEFFDFITSHLN
jgi:glycosyltransferase involved in cell wall biosynthesis